MYTQDQQYQPEQAARQRASIGVQGMVAGNMPPSESIHDITQQSIGGLCELLGALTQLADRVSGSIPQSAESSNKPMESCYLEQVGRVRQLVSACHGELARIQRVL